jgi:hypothetical protein
MKWASWAWRVIVEGFTLCVAIALLLRFTSPFERITIDVLILIYVTVVSSFMMSGLVRAEQAQLNLVRYLETMRAVGAGAVVDTPDLLEARAASDEQIARHTVRWYITAGFTSVIYCATIISLLVDLSK